MDFSKFLNTFRKIKSKEDKTSEENNEFVYSFAEPDYDFTEDEVGDLPFGKTDNSADQTDSTDKSMDVSENIIAETDTHMFKALQETEPESFDGAVYNDVFTEENENNDKSEITEEYSKEKDIPDIETYENINTEDSSLNDYNIVTLVEECNPEVKNDSKVNISEIIDMKIRMSASEEKYGDRLIFEEFRMEKSLIISNLSDTFIHDLDISNVGYEQRTYNILKRMNIDKVSDLLKLRYTSLLNAKNCGAKTVNDIIAKSIEFMLNKSAIDYSDALTLDADDEQKTTSLNALTLISDTTLSVRAKNGLNRSGILTVSDLMNLNNDNIKHIRNIGEKTVLEIIEFKNESSGLINKGDAEYYKKFLSAKSYLSEVFYSSPLFLLNREKIEELMLAENYQKYTDEVISALVSEKIIISNGSDLYELVKTRCFDYLNSLNLKSEKGIDVLSERVKGRVLEDIACEFGATRERIRQIQEKMIKILIEGHNDNKVCITEFCYLYLFEKYDLDENVFLYITGEPRSTYNLLSLITKNGTEDAEEIITDNKIPDNVKIGLYNYIRFSDSSPYIYPEQGSNRRVLKDKSAIRDYLISTFCQNEVSIYDFADKYNEFLTKYELQEKLGLVSVNGKNEIRAFEGSVTRNPKVLYKHGKKIRYYDFNTYDYTMLLETLDLSSYYDTEISTLKFINQYPELMGEYDIRDEYELHIILKKIVTEGKIFNNDNNVIDFERQPYIRFGNGSKEQVIKDVLFSVAPVSTDNLANALYEEYGYKKDSAIACFNCIKEYYCGNGMYSIEFADMPENQFSALKENLTEDLYYIYEIKQIYSELFPDGDISLVSSYNLRKMGWLVYNDYAINNAGSATEYFEKVLTEQDVMSIKKVSRRYAKIQDFNSVLSSLRYKYTIIEYSPYEIINIRKLGESGVEIKNLIDFCQKVFDYTEDSSYFTFESLLKSGFDDGLFSLGFDNWFYSSVLRADKRFSYIKIGGTVLFYKGNMKISIMTFVVDIINKIQLIELDELITLLYDNYGISQDIDSIRFAVNNNPELYYDAVMNTVYKDYDIFYKTISNIED